MMRSLPAHLERYRRGPCALAAALALGALACAGGAGGEASSAGGEREVAMMSRETAIEAARDAAAAAGYPRERYEVEAVSYEREGRRAESWRIDLVHTPPTPPGGHCTVYVDAATGRTEVLHGE